MKFDYKYNFSLELCNPIKKLNFNDYIGALTKAVDEYNDVCLKRSPNCKRLTLAEENIYSDIIIMSLESTSPINKIGLAIRYFSQILIKISAEFSEVTFNKQLFNITQIVSPQIKQDTITPILKPNDVDDATFVKAIIDYLLNKSNCSSTIYKKRVQALEEMKRIAIESGIIGL